MKQPQHHSRARTWIALAILGAVLIAAAVVAFVVTGGKGGDPVWTTPRPEQSSPAPSASERATTVAGLRALLDQVKSFDRGINHLYDAANADPESDTPVNDLGTTEDICSEAVMKYLNWAASDPQAVQAAGLPATIGHDAQTDCLPDDEADPQPSATRTA